MTICRTVLFYALAASLVSTPVLAQAPTTVILVRHAEKGGDPGDRDPELSDAGRERASTLAHVLGELDIDAIYSTPFLRTRHTAQPIADLLGVEITVTPPTRTMVDDIAATIRRDHAGDVILVVGHSNTIPGVVNALGAGPFENLTEDEYDDLFVVTLTADGTASVVRLRYGRETP